jgi:hypothetical protein
MKSLAQKVFDKLNDRDPDLIAEIIAEIESEEDKSISIDQYMNANPDLETDCMGNCFSDADPGL